ncbi:redoxin domain-containing protein [Paludisphaera soli]|uniref:redoxin domain-containing protein n=1 Tax=Paludisphaera soli TaxID=2712865 RepID=UPI001F0FE20B|nr:redoxin domain-containing protein [Paludisphaera soli]
MLRSDRVLAGAFLAIFAALAASPAVAFDEAPATLAVDRLVGQRMADFTLPDLLSQRDYRLYGFAGKPGAVLVFLGTECPVGDLYLPRLVELNKEYGPKGIVFLGINSNAGDSAESIAAHAREFHVDFPILKDRDNVVADSALAERTPEVLVLDGMARIRYRGAIDDQYVVGSRKPAPERNYLREALDAVVAKGPIEVAATEVAGCLIQKAEPKAAQKANVSRVRAPSAEIRSAREAIEGKVEEVGQVTYASAAVIIQEKCQSCHRPKQVAPFSLLGYDDARKHSAMIREVVDVRRMPPWHADPRHGSFSNDRSLSAKERATLLAWIDQGAPLGDPKDVPAPKTFPEGWSIGEPDVVFEIPETYTVPAQGVLEYVRFRVPTNFTEDVWIRGGEAMPGDRSVVHHILMYVDDHKKERRLGLGGSHLCGYAPGDMPSVFPPGTAKKIPAGSDLIFELHYTPNGRVRQDRSKLGLSFAKEPVVREAFTLPIVNPRFVIPPGEPAVPVSSSMTLPKEVRLLSFMPHMHVRGKDFSYTITKPGGEPEVALSVPAYDFGWQSYYTLKEPTILPKGTKIDCLAHFDNSADNPSNPDPTKAVRWGDQTFEEMMIGYIDVDVPVGDSLDRRTFREEPRPGGGLLQALLGRGPRAKTPEAKPTP